MAVLSAVLLGTPPTFTTWNPSDKDAAIALSSGNAVATGSGAAYKSVRSNTSHTTGKKYYEQVAVTQAAPAGPYIGFASSAFLLSADLGSSSISFGIDPFSTFQAVSGGGLSLAGSHAAGSTGDRWMVAIDFDAGKFWIGKNNAWLSSGNPSTGANAYGTFTANPTLFPGTTCYNNSNSAQLYAGASSFSYTMPTGFSAWGI